jgi:hypothetical protein
VCLNVNAMMMCGLIHASILKSGRAYVTEEEEADYIFRCREFALCFRPGDRPPYPRRNFQNHWNMRCEDEWKRAYFQFTIGACARAQLWFERPAALAEVLDSVLLDCGSTHAVCLSVCLSVSPL